MLAQQGGQLGHAALRGAVHAQRQVVARVGRLPLEALHDAADPRHLARMLLGCRAVDGALRRAAGGGIQVARHAGPALH